MFNLAVGNWFWFNFSATIVETVLQIKISLPLNDLKKNILIEKNWALHYLSKIHYVVSKLCMNLMFKSCKWWPQLTVNLRWYLQMVNNQVYNDKLNGIITDFLFPSVCVYVHNTCKMCIGSKKLRCAMCQYKHPNVKCKMCSKVWSVWWLWKCKHPSASAQEMDSWLSPQSTNCRRLRTQLAKISFNCVK